MLFLGVDGGGTKTAFALIDDDGALVAKHTTTTCYHAEVGMDGARNVLEKGLDATLLAGSATISDVAFAFFGLPAYGEDVGPTAAMDELPSAFMSRDKYQCDNDMVNGWAAAFDCGDGINVVAGTGSIAYGVRRSESARCGGWGEIFGDEGSAYWIGCRGLQVFSRMSDGRISKGPLHEIFASSLNVNRDIEVSGLVHSQWSGDRSKIAQLARLVSEAANAGDNEAAKIFCNAGRELALLVDSTRRALGFEDGSRVPVSYSGGVFRSNQLIFKPFEDALREFSIQYSIQEPEFTPVVGAARYARHIALSSRRS